MQNESDSGSQPDEHDAANLDMAYIRLRKKAREDEIGIIVNYQTWEMQDRGIILLSDLGVCIEGDDTLRPITSGTKAELLEQFKMLLDEAYPDEDVSE